MASGGLYRLNLENCTLFFLSLGPSTTVSTILVYVECKTRLPRYISDITTRNLSDYSLSWVINKVNTYADSSSSVTEGEEPENFISKFT